jgi:hypothetical protein
MEEQHADLVRALNSFSEFMDSPSSERDKVYRAHEDAFNTGLLFGTLGCYFTTTSVRVMKEGANKTQQHTFSTKTALGLAGLLIGLAGNVFLHEYVISDDASTALLLGANVASMSYEVLRKPANNLLAYLKKLH